MVDIRQDIKTGDELLKGFYAFGEEFERLKKENEELKTIIVAAHDVLNDAYYEKEQEYDTQGVNVTHRILAGGIKK